jgi:hypothetical protein
MVGNALNARNLESIRTELAAKKPSEQPVNVPADGCGSINDAGAPVGVQEM